MMLGGSFFDKTILFTLFSIESVVIFAIVVVLMYRNYEAIEQFLSLRLSTYAAEIYDLKDRMFQRVPMNKCYTLILVPMLVLAAVGLLGGLKFGLLSSLAFGLSFGFFGYRAPGMIIRFQFQRRMELFDKQLVDALNMMANAIKSGLSFMQVVQVIEREMPAPCSEEFGMALKENQVGVNLNDALMNMTKRMPSDDLYMIVNSVVTLSQQGGDLSEAFDTIAATIRDRQRVLEKVRTLAQAGITQGMILSAIPFFMLGMQYVIQPQYAMLLFTTPLGLAMLGGMCVMIATGAYAMKRILVIDV